MDGESEDQSVAGEICDALADVEAPVEACAAASNPAALDDGMVASDTEGVEVAQAAEQQSDPVASGSSSSSSPPPAPASADDGDVASDTEPRRQPDAEPQPRLTFFADGLRVVRESHVDIDPQRNYTRFIVSCPVEGHRQCMRKRNSGPRLTSSLGRLEPVAYVVLWAKAGAACPTRAVHMRMPAPSVAEMRAWLAEHPELANMVP